VDRFVLLTRIRFLNNVNMFENRIIQDGDLDKQNSRRKKKSKQNQNKKFSTTKTKL